MGRGVTTHEHKDMTPTDLKAWREARGWSRAELARRLPVPLRTLEAWEWGVNRIPSYLYRALRDMEAECAG